ncbi:MAG: 1-acyl-sn-glycerol-3-phosphate acyltransferase, partial [Solirubrobacteraceae bacterium]|nr:1-acyl-sn-glycerol-3-phosphate acyltransferase [Solirubrobacteraceae bacterium]
MIGQNEGEMTEEKLAPMKEQVYKDPRPAPHFDRFLERSRTRDPDWAYEAVRIV